MPFGTDHGFANFRKTENRGLSPVFVPCFDFINDTLRRVIETGILEADLRRISREELAHHS